MNSKKTKIVCSIGPTCEDEEIIRSMILAGMNVARFNFSHGNYEWHKKAMEKVRKISSELNRPVAILLDTKGPEIRTGLTENESKIDFFAGEKVEVVADNSFCKNKTTTSLCHISISWKDATQKIKKGNKILIADGLIELIVDNIENEKILCTSMNNGSIGSRKNVNLIGIHADLPILSEKDKEDLKFGKEMDVDFIAASFVSFPEEISIIKKFLKEIDLNAMVIAKIENEEGLENIAKIADEADGIMVARGDLGIQIPLQKIPLVQKEIIKTCHQKGKVVITATQMLESMITNPRPTRAELTDVSNAIFDGSDAVMLSGETACGKYPVEAVQTMALIAQTTENSTDYKERMHILNTTSKLKNSCSLVITYNAYEVARNTCAEAIITPTLYGKTAWEISSFRPEQSIIAVTPNQKVQKQLLLAWGVIPLLCDTVTSTRKMIDNAIKDAIKSGKIQKDDKVILCAGIPLGQSPYVNTIQMLNA